MDRETLETLLALLNPLHGSLDRQTYDEKVRENFDAPDDAEYAVTITARQERDLTQAVCILEARLRDARADEPLSAEDPCTDEARENGCICRLSYVWSNDIDPPEPVIARDCPLHGYAPDPDEWLQQKRDDQIEDRLT